MEPPDPASSRDNPQSGTEPRVGSAWRQALWPPLTILAWLLVLGIVGWLLDHVTRTLILIVLSAILAFTLAPLARLLARWLPRWLALVIAYVVGVATVLVLAAILVGTAAEQVGSLVRSLPRYTDELRSQEPQLLGVLSPFGVTAQSFQDVQQQGIAQVESAGSEVARESVSRVAEILGTVVDIVLVLILSVYFESVGPRIAHWLQYDTPPDQRHHGQLVVAVVNRVVGGYIRGTLTLATLVGLLVGGGLTVIGVPYAVLLGVVAFFMEFLPVIGVFISGAASVLIALSVGWVPAVIVLAYFVVVHVIEGDLIGPRIMGKAVGIHPATGLVALVAGTELFGIWGALFAAPTAGLLQAILTAAWLEMRGGDAQTVMRIVADQEGGKVADKIET